MQKSFVLLSGGIDSTTCLHIALSETDDPVEAISINYGQRHLRELEFAEHTCRRLDVKHHVLDLSSIVPKTMLTDNQANVPDISYDEIEGVSPTYVPFRNGLMLSALTSFVAGQWDMELNRGVVIDEFDEWSLYFGAHAEDARNWAYPDCTPEFIGAMANAIYIGTYRHIRLHTPLQWMTKSQIIRTGDALNVRWSETFSCYKGGTTHCGTCPTCRSRRAGFKEAGIADPTRYVITVD